MSVVYTDEARLDLIAAFDHIAEQSVAAAEAFYARLTSVVDRLDDGAFEGPDEQLTTGEIVQSWPVYPFRVYYQRRRSVLYVLRVYHQARAPIVKQPARRRRRAPSKR